MSGNMWMQRKGFRKEEDKYAVTKIASIFD